MNADQREAVRENVKYLRNVRPIDPEEISEYVDGQPHPAVVRQVLREEAVSLGLLERDDGTFEPVADEPVHPQFRGVEAFPDRESRLVEDLLVERFDPDWHRGDSGDALRTAIRRLKENYFRNRPVEYDETAALGYAIYHLPDNYAAVQYVLDEIAVAGLLSRKLRVLDVGAGVGGPALGVRDYLPDDALVDYHAVEPSAAADVFEHLVSQSGTSRGADDAGRNFHATLHRETAEAFDPTEAVSVDGEGARGEFDLILFANVLNELDDPEAVVLDSLDALADDGTLVAIEPADRETAIGLRQVERAVADEQRAATVFAPTVRLWPGERPTDRGWSFDVKPDLAVPGFQRRLDEAASGHQGGKDSDRNPGEFVNVDVQYAYSVLRTDGRERVEATADSDRYAKMAEMERHVTNRVNLLAAKLSHSLADGDDAARDPKPSTRNPLFVVSDGSESVDHFAVLTRETALNRDLLTADYGDLLAFEGVLVLWNDDEDAYNLVVDEETVVDAIPV